MATAISTALLQIHRTIPKAILERAFIPTKYNQLRRDPFMPGSVDEIIIEKVIHGYVTPMIDTIGATEAVIPLKGLGYERVDTDKYVVHIPKDRTNGRSISSALAIIWYGMGQIYPDAGSAMVGQALGWTTASNFCGPDITPALAVANSYKPLVSSQSSNVRVVDGNTVLIEDVLVPTDNAFMRVILTHDRELSTLSQHTWLHFAKLCEYACKQYIYTKLVLEIDMAELVGGQELGKFKEIVEGYSEAGELFDTYLQEKWRKISFMADEGRYTRHLKSLVGRYK